MAELEHKPRLVGFPAANLNTRPNPYVGPRSFLTGEKLYGRDAEVRQLLDLIIAERIILLHSPSGAGKSSLVQAGLIPGLEQEGFTILPPVRVNLELPLEFREDCNCNRYIFSTLLALEESLEDSEKIPASELVKMSLEQYLAHRIKNERTPESVLLFFDQFEEILTADPTDKVGKTQFFHQLGSALRDRKLWALFAIRDDYVAALDPFVRPIPTRLNNRFRLDFLGINSARQAIQQPALESGVKFTDPAVGKLVKDLRQVQVQQWDGSLEKQDGLYVEPVQLQVVCYHLWQQLTSDQVTISETDITAVGNVDQSLAEYYAGEVCQAATTIQIPEFRIRRWFEDQLITSEGIRSLVQKGRDDSEGLDNRAIKMLENAHLVRSEKRLGSTWFELAHDRLIEPVRKNNAAWFQTNLNLFQRQARVWHAQGRPNSLLLHGQELEEAKLWADANSNDLLPREREYLSESLDEEARILERQELERREQALKLEAAQKVAEAERMRAEEQARSAAQLKRRNIFLWLALMIAMFLVLATFYFYQDSSNKAVALGTSYALQESAAQTAQAASIQAVAERNIAKTEEARAEAASLMAERQRNTAVAAEAEALSQRNLALTAQAEAEEQRNIAVANEQARATAQANAETQLGARSEGLAELAQTYLDSQTDLSLLISVEAVRIQESVKARSNLLAVLQRGLDWNSREFGPEFPRESYAFNELAFSPNGRYLAWGNLTGEVVLYDLDNQDEIWREKNHSGYVYGLEFCQAGRELFLASGSVDNYVILYKIPEKEPTWRAQAPNLIQKLSFSPDCKRIAVAAGSSIQIFDDQGERVKRLEDVQIINEIAWSPDGNWLVTGLPTGILKIYETENWRETTLGRQGLEVTSLAWTPDSQILVSTGKDQKINLWNIEEGDDVRSINKRNVGDQDSIAISKNGKLLALGSRDGSIYIWDIETLQPIDQITSHIGPVEYIAFSEFGGKVLLASAGFDHFVSVHEINLEQTLNMEVSKGTTPVSFIAMRPDGSMITASLNSGSLSIDNNEISPPDAEAMNSVALAIDNPLGLAVDASGLIHPFERYASGDPDFSEPIRASSKSISSIAISSDAQLAVSSSCVEEREQEESEESIVCARNEIKVWDIVSASEKYPALAYQGDEITSLAISSDSRLLAAGSRDGTVVMWDLLTNAEQKFNLSTFATSISSLAFSPDMKTLAAGSSDLKIVLIDLNARLPLPETLNGSPASVLSLAYDPTGDYLYSGHSDGTVLRWDISSRLLVERACQAAERNMTLDEWQRLFPGLPYQETCA
jgi:WD40 repeat protein